MENLYSGETAGMDTTDGNRRFGALPQTSLEYAYNGER
jgi:hypothetical protein